MTSKGNLYTSYKEGFSKNLEGSFLSDDQGFSIERKELYDKLNRLDYYQAKVQKRMADLERKLKRVYELDQETQATIDAGLEVMALKSDKESTR